MSWEWGEFGDYVSADEKRRRADALVRKLEKQGRQLSPVRLTGRAIANTFWGKAWGQNLESYGTYASRLPRGRSYVRSGAVVDLQIGRGSVAALVSGTELYTVKIKIDPLGKAAWQQLKQDCAGKVGSLIDLLRGKLSGPVMEVITRKDGGLFPKPKEIQLDCSCPDHADLCKHVAATLYGVGAHLDESPELLFGLRGVDHLELINSAAHSLTSDLNAPANGASGTLDEGSLAEVFGIEFAGTVPAPEAGLKPKRAEGQKRTVARTAPKPASTKRPSKHKAIGQLAGSERAATEKTTRTAKPAVKTRSASPKPTKNNPRSRPAKR